MRSFRIFSIMMLALSILLAPVFLTSIVKADIGIAKVKILMLPNVGCSWVDSCEEVKDGVIEACMLRGEFISQNVPRTHPEQNDVNYPPYYSATTSIITAWAWYEYIITQEAGLIIVNTHGEILPVPGGYTKEEWVDAISEAMLTRRITWVHVAMYPFYYVKYENGTSETWGENGFKYFMNHINKGYVDCYLPGNASSTETTRVEHSEALSDNNMIGNWIYGDANPIKKFWYAELGRPLKSSDFKDYAIMPLYQINDTGSQDVYMTGAVIAYVKAGQRHLTEHGSGVYIHLGVRYFYDGDGDQMNNTDFGRGFIGTAAALWVEANRFESSSASWDKSEYWGVYNATVFAHPTVIGFQELDTSYVKVRLGFGIHGIYKFPEETNLEGFNDARFSVWTDSSNWSDTQFKANVNNPALSKQASSSGTEVLSGLNTERSEELFGLATSSIIYVGSLVGGIVCPPVGAFFTVIGGLRLMGAWASFLASGTGVDTYASYVWMSYYPLSFDSEPIEDYIYTEMSSIIIVDVKIPTSNRSGWLTLPLTYYIGMHVDTGDPLENVWMEINEIIDIAVFLDRSGGQEDAGVLGDAGNDYASSRSIGFPILTHGYLDGDADAADCYSFTLSSSNYIMVELTPPQYVDFDLELKSPNGNTWTSQNGPSQTEYIQLYAVQGLWKIKISKVYGSGVYTLLLNYAGGGGCPMLSVWNGTAFKEDAILEIHSYNDITLKHRMQQKPIPTAGLYFLKLNELDNFTSHIDQVKLYTVDYEGELHLCPLLLAYHDMRGLVTYNLLLDDDIRINLEPTQEIKLCFLKTIPYENTEYFMFQINGYNKKLP